MVENELQFVGWKAFQQMVPSIVQLEISRLERIIQRVRDEPHVCNALVKARFELKKFAACLQQAEKESLEETCAPHLQAALLTVSMTPDDQDDDLAASLRYVADRLNHVNDRMKMIY